MRHKRNLSAAVIGDADRSTLPRGSERFASSGSMGGVGISRL